MPLASPATEPKRHWLSLPLWYPAGAGGLAPARHWLSLPLWYPAGGVLSLSPADFAFSLIFCPHPPAPLPGGKGETLRLFYARGCAPCIPATEPGRHLQNLPSGCLVGGLPFAGRGWVAFRYPAGGRGACPLAALARPAPGERTISNAEVPLPRSPLSLAAGTAHREPLPAVFAANRGYSSRGCKGRSPLHKITLSPPLPRRGRGLGGWGQESKPKARSAGD